MDAVTLHCPACGAAAEAEATECSFCHAKLATVACPKCLGLVFIGSRYCAHCGARTQSPEPRGGAVRRCPRDCTSMHPERLGETEIDECPQCLGLWVSNETFERLCADNAKEAPVLTPRTTPRGVPVVGKLKPVRYVKCPECGKVMNRSNFSKTSGIIVDTCAKHGVWFDADELRLVLEFIRAGGLETSRQKELETLAEERRLAMLRQNLMTPSGSRPKYDEERSWGKGVGAGILEFIFTSKLRIR